MEQMKIYFLVKVPHSSSTQDGWSSCIDFLNSSIKGTRDFLCKPKSPSCHLSQHILLLPPSLPRQCLVRGCCWSLPFHDNEQASLAIVDVLIHVQDMDNVRAARGSPVILDLLTRLGAVVQELWRKTESKVSQAPLSCCNWHHPQSQLHMRKPSPATG